MPRVSLLALSDTELLSTLSELVKKERATTLDILLHLNEVDRRRLYLPLGFTSLFEYCTLRLGYSSSAAGRRIHAARCIRLYPEIRRLLEKNEVNLVSLSMAASILTPHNKDEVLGKIRGKSQREVESIVATYRPSIAYRDRARPVCVPVPVEQTPTESRQNCNVLPPVGVAPPSSSPSPPATAGLDPARKNGHCASPAPEPPTCSPSKPVLRLEKKLLVQFLASEASRSGGCKEGDADEGPGETFARDREAICRPRVGANLISLHTRPGPRPGFRPRQGPVHVRDPDR